MRMRINDTAFQLEELEGFPEFLWSRFATAILLHEIVYDNCGASRDPRFWQKPNS